MKKIEVTEIVLKSSFKKGVKGHLFKAKWFVVAQSSSSPHANIFVGVGLLGRLGPGQFSQKKIELER